MVHEREDSKICGPIMPQGGIQALETMLYTLDYINNSTLLNNFTIGAHVLDDCDKGNNINNNDIMYFFLFRNFLLDTD